MKVRNWCFTCYDLDNFTVPDTHKNFRYCVYQGEKCPDTGNIHLQGYVEWRQPVSRKTIQNHFHVPKTHFAPRHKDSNQEAARNYCMKEESRWCEPIEFGTFTKEAGKRNDLNDAREVISKKRKRDDLYLDPELSHIMAKYPRWAEKVYELSQDKPQIKIIFYPWQAILTAKLCEPPVHRKIYWIYSTKSNTGKTTYFDYISSKFDVLPADGKYADILYAYDNHEIIWFDYTRAEAGYESYKMLEKFSNHGYCLSTKYISTKKYIKAHVVVTSNHLPNESKLPDRFEIINIDPPKPDEYGDSMTVGN